MGHGLEDGNEGENGVVVDGEGALTRKGGRAVSSAPWRRPRELAVIGVENRVQWTGSIRDL